MANAVEQSRWMARMADLTASPVDDWDPDAVDQARTTATQLVALARELYACGAEAAPGDLPKEDYRYLIELLAGVDDPAASATPHSDNPEDGFLQVLAEDAGTTVYVCRTVFHRSGSCLFDAPDATSNLCGQVLTAAHKVRSYQRVSG